MLSPTQPAGHAQPAVVRADLESYAQAIRTEHDACCAAASQSLEHAMRCGDLLTKAKADVPHGQWQKWLANNFPASSRTAQQYMRLANNREVVELKAQATADLTIEQAAELLADQRPETQLAKLEAGIDDARAVAEELVSIEQGGLWAKSHPSFEAYLEDRFQGEVDIASIRTLLDTLVIDRTTRWREYADKRPSLFGDDGGWRDGYSDERLPLLDGTAYIGFLAPRHQVQLWPSIRRPSHYYVSHVEWFEGNDAGGVQSETRRPVRLNHALLTWLIEADYGLPVGGEWLPTERSILPLPEGAA